MGYKGRCSTRQIHTRPTRVSLWLAVAASGETLSPKQERPKRFFRSDGDDLLRERLGFQLVALLMSPLYTSQPGACSGACPGELSKWP